MALPRASAGSLPSRSHPGRRSVVSRTPVPSGVAASGKTLPILNDYYKALFTAYGAQGWWPGRSPFEIIVGAILVQNTAWTNAARAIESLRAKRLLIPASMRRMRTDRLARLIRSSGYYRQKARKLKAFLAFLDNIYSGSLNKMFAAPTGLLRDQLLSVSGIGPETADSILLYAGGHPVFVVDAYTRLILERHRHAQKNDSYESLRALFEQSLPRDVKAWNEYHALIVRTGKHHCLSKAPKCEGCALKPFLPAAEELPS